ncbi:MAG: hypothetical protein ABJD07_09845, partial [Gemmatimonadaceae bacterium]
SGSPPGTSPTPPSGATPPAVPATARYRVTINGFEVNGGTTEDLLRRDGAGDEIYAAANIAVLDRVTPRFLANPTTVKSLVHGDAGNYGGRVQAGSASPMGGMQRGDHFPANVDPSSGSAGAPSTSTFPLLLFEGPLTNGQEVIVIHPTLWEWDGDQTAFGIWTTQATINTAVPITVLSTLAQEIASASISVTDLQGPGDNVLTAPGLKLQELMAMLPNGQPISIRSGMDRPIGLAPLSSPPGKPASMLLKWQDRVVVLTKEKIDAALGGTYTIGATGIIPVRLVDSNPMGDLGYNGNYVLYLRVERVP